MKAIHIIAVVLLIIGGLNWGLTAFNFNVVTTVFGSGTIANVIYILVGLSALWELFTHKGNCALCVKDEEEDDIEDNPMDSPEM